jgi:hypothetical protein
MIDIGRTSYTNAVNSDPCQNGWYLNGESCDCRRERELCSRLVQHVAGQNEYPMATRHSPIIGEFRPAGKWIHARF